jgi:hypothetical protein
MHYTITPEDIKIEELRHMVTNIWNIKQYRTNLPLPMFFVDPKPAPNNNIQCRIYAAVQYNTLQDVKYLRLHLNRRVTWCKHIFTKQKQLGMTLTKIHWLLGRKSKLSTSNNILIYKAILNQTNLHLPNTTVGYSFHFKHGNPRMLPI